MKLSFVSIYGPPDEMARMAREAEEMGFDNLWVSETKHDPFTGLAIAAQATSRISLYTGLAVAFARNPMSMATLANDVQLASHGRFHLGLGSQLKSHILRRFSMEWSRPVARMREYVMALRAIWDSYGEDNRLSFRGEFYRHTLKAPFFDPGPNPFGPPPVILGAVGEAMTALAGEVADGFLVHSVSSRRFLESVTLPALRRGLELGGRTLNDLDVHLAPIMVTGRDEREYQAALRMAKEQIAFYISIPTYNAILELHDLFGLQSELHRLAANGRVSEMADVIDAEVLETFAIVGEPKEAAAKIWDRFGDVASSVSFYNTNVSDPAYWLPVVEELRDVMPVRA
jgi:probable F420-dependent oxidoreductase